MTRYDALIAEASYYAWAARKGFPLAGNNPITGISRERKVGPSDERALGRVAYKALARHLFTEARRQRPESPLP